MINGGRIVVWLPAFFTPVAPVQAESRVMSLTIHPGLPPITMITREPWELTPADLTAERIWYNLLTKPGFRWLLVDILLGLLLVVLVWRGAWALVRWSQAPRSVQLPVTSVQAKPTPTRPGLVVEIAGTVKITTSGGIIYQAWESLTQSGERELAPEGNGLSDIRYLPGSVRL